MEENKDLNNTPGDEKFDIIGMDESYKSQNFKKKKRGIAGFFQKTGAAIANWWKPLKKWKKWVISIATALVAVILALLIVFFSVFDYNYKEITTNPEELGFENVIDEKIVNIALFGIDTRSTKSFEGNSDSIMVLSINTETKAVKIVSIMRDSLVKIERDGRTSYNKINSAYAYDGPELAIKTINRNFGLDISEYATVNFYGMAEIIDAVGGIEVEFTRQEVSTSSKDGFNGLVRRHCEKIGVNPEPYYIKTEGKHKVNGIQAVAYSRIRKFVNIWGTNNDFGRTDRQRYVMEQLFNKAIKLEKSKYVGLVKALIPYTETSLSYTEIMGLAMDVLLESPTFEQTRMPLSEYQMKAPYIQRVGSTVYYDLDFAKNLLHAFFYEDISPEDYVKQNGIGKNDWYAQVAGGSSGGTHKPQDTVSSKPSTSSSAPSSSSQATSSDESEQVPSTPSDVVDSSASTDSSSSEAPSSSEETSTGVDGGSDQSSSSEPPVSSETSSLPPPLDTSSDNTVTQ